MTALFLILGLLGCAPHSLSLSAPTETVSGTVAVQIVSSEAQVFLKVGDDQEQALDLVDGKGSVQLDTRELEDGEVAILARTAGRGSVSTSSVLRTDNSPPKVEILASSTTVLQGNTVAIVLRLEPMAAHPTLTFLDRERVMYRVASGPDGDVYRAFVGVPIRTKPGDYPLLVSSTDALGNAGRMQGMVGVQTVDWPITGKLRFRKGKAKVESEPFARMRKERDGTYKLQIEEWSLQGPMQMPMEGRVSSVFGAFREYPDKSRNHHDAVDLSNRKRTPVHAAGPGTVHIARKQSVHGNAVIVGHGQGVFSLYSHHDELVVTEGQQVSAGDLLGYMGDTGRTTGPHLHWGVVVDQVAINPMQWTEPGLFQLDGDWVKLAPETGGRSP